MEQKNEISSQFRGIGKNQLALSVRMLNDNWKIRRFVNYNTSEKLTFLQDAEGNDIWEVPDLIFRSMLGRQLFIPKRIYSTTQPDTETFDYTINPEYAPILKALHDKSKF